MAVQLLLLHNSDKTMPLDLSCGRDTSCGSDRSDDDDDDKDDIIVTLAVPGRQDTTRHCSEPIVIASDSEDSDADVTIVSDFSTLGTLRGSSINKGNSFGEVLGISITGPPDDTDDDCFVSFSSSSNNVSKSRSTAIPHAVRAGVKRIFEDSSSQSSVDSPPSPLDSSFVQGKDAFLSDASSQSSAEDLRLILTSADSIDKNLLTAINRSTVSPTKVTSPADDLDLLNSFNRKSFSLQHSAAVDIGDILPVKELSQTTLQTSDDADHATGSSKALTKSALKATNSGLNYRISHLLARPESSISPTIVGSGLAVSKTAKASPAQAVSVTEFSSLFCVPSFDSLYPDASSSTAVNGAQSSKGLSKLATSKSPPSISDPDVVLLSQRPVGVRRRSLVDKVNINVGTASDSTSTPNSRASRSPAGGDKEWTVQSKGGCKVLLRRSMSQAVSTSSALPDPASCSSSLVVSKRRRLSANMAATALDDFSSDARVVVSSLETAMCYGCRLQICTSHLSYCMAGHGCCGHCLQSQVKTLLASGKKGTLKCRYTSCMSFYLVSQLHNSLPSMVVEILEEKLDREYCDNAAKLMLKAIGKGLIGAFSDDDFDDRDGDHSGTVKSIKEEVSSILELPKTWEPMSNKEEYRLVELVRGGSDEYTWVAALFHQSMKRPRAQIISIKRVQNQILWQFYMVKKKQMERDSNRLVVERNLFHGTCRNVVDSICRNNFDWRLCGAHGTMYGQGSYFAQDAAYSHMYTDQPPSRPGHHHGPPGSSTSGAIFSVGPPPSHHQISGPSPSSSASSAAAATQMLFQAFPGSSHAVSIAALHSCRFAHLQGSLLPPGAPPLPVPGPSSSGYVPMSTYYFGPPPSSPSTHAVPTIDAPTVTQPPHVHCMFLARVLVGDYMTGKSSYRKPPAVDVAQPYGRCYDSCVNDLDNPTIFVVFNNAQCYPEYVIEYTNKPRDTAV